MAPSINRRVLLGLAFAALATRPGIALAQEPATPAAPAAQPAAEPEKVDIITPHITDSHELDLPSLNLHEGLVYHYQLPRWKPLQIGGLAIDMSPTKHVVWLVASTMVCMITMLWAAAWHRRHEKNPAVARGFAGGMEALVLYIRQDVVLPNVGPHGAAYAPFILTLFFFILFANLVGLFPYGSTPTGNVSVTAALAIISFLVIEISGIRTLGKKYWSTIFYWNHDLHPIFRVVLFIIMTPVEIISKFTKPFALTIRLFANMTAGHVVLLALLSLIFTFHSYLIGVAPLSLALASSLLEVFVAFLQAYIFALLTAVFIGQIRQAAH